VSALTKTAAGIVIGDEILSGKVEDTNTSKLIATLREAGVALRRLVTISDDPEVIAEEVRRCSDSFDYVFTSGGLGPTHDDRTMEGVARAFGVAVTRDPLVERRVRKHWGDRINDAALKLADLPTGATLLDSGDGLLPVVTFHNLFILPGVPQIFAAKMELIKPLLQGRQRVLQSIYLDTDETSIAAQINEVVEAFPEVDIGSYPRLDDPSERVRITVEAAEAAAVERAVARLLELLPASRVVRTEA
jgi:molybdenum cofactor synthesis domain-containing protein